ncbi:MAG: hypothetical protein KKF62_10505 [Bacteroidetes bacterium]|nr:hypothetical protein [Bacteroidota bacterium]MBU1114578.1 hypothetical protein [Bacteroidota bacterium]MBU1799057.1 hypothetical protein [Bacteroidota bacterium]
MKKYSLVLLILLFSCNFNGSPSMDDMVHVYVNVLVAEEEFKSNADSMKIVINKIYKDYNLDEKIYLNELENYKFDEATWDEFFLLAENYLDTLKSQEKRK